MAHPVGYAVLLTLLLLLNYGNEGAENAPHCALRYAAMSDGMVNACCPGYGMNRWHLCVPECEQAACAANEACVAPNVCACRHGYSRLDADADCQPICAAGCAENAHCVAPHTCACQLGYIPVKRDCRAICGEGYVWNASIEGCEARCRNGSSWDNVARMCVQRLQAQVQLIAYQGNAAGEWQGERDEAVLEGAVDGDSELPLRKSATRDGHNLQFYAAENATEASSAAESGALPPWLNNGYILSGLIALTLLAFSYMGHLLWQRQRTQQILSLEVKTNLNAEYELDRSQIMVY